MAVGEDTGAAEQLPAEEGQLLRREPEVAEGEQLTAATVEAARECKEICEDGTVLYISFVDLRIV